MKLNSLLPAIMLAAGIQGFAAIPLHFRDCVNINQGGGKMEWPCVEGTREIDPETGAWKTHGEPLFDADGSITLKPYDDITAADGMYFRTTKLGTYLEEPIPSDYMFLAMDYKSNMNAADCFVFYHEMGNWVSMTNYYPIVDTHGEYSTVYMILSRTTPADWAVQPGEEWGNNSNWKNNYMWIGWNDPAVKTPDFRFTVKNIRMLTAAEVITEIKDAHAPAGVIGDVLSSVNVPSDIDDDMGGEKIYACTGANNLFMTRMQYSILPKDHNLFKFEYKAVGNADKPVFWAVQGGGLTANVIGDAFEVVENPYEADWKTYTVDLTALLTDAGYAQNPFSNDYMYMQLTASDGNVMYIKNARWEAPAKEPEAPVALGYPAYFRDAVNMASDGGGHMDWPSNDRTYDPETGAVVNWGTPAFEADGSITIRPNAGCIGGGLYFRTTKLKTYADPKPIPADKVIFAFDYKSNKTASDMVFFHHEGGGISIANGNMIEITGDNYATTYMILNARGNWATEEDAGWGDRYAWVSWNDPNVHDTDWELTIKNLRYLSLAEASEECSAVEGDIVDALNCANADITRDFDEEMDGGCYVYSRALAAANPVLSTNNQVKPLPAADTQFVFEYKLVGQSFAPRFHPVQGGTYSTHYTNAPKLIPLAEDEDPYEAEWKTYVMDFTELRADFNFAKAFGSNDQLHVQMIEMNDEDVIWIRNVRWTSKENTSAVESIAIDQDNSKAPVIYYNLQGQRVNNPANGIFIRCQGSKAQKVYVK